MPRHTTGNRMDGVRHLDAAALEVSGEVLGARPEIAIRHDFDQANGTYGWVGISELFELTGPVDRLVRVLTGQSPALVEVQQGRCHVRGSLGAAAALTRATLLFALATPDGGDLGG